MVNHIQVTVVPIEMIMNGMKLMRGHIMNTDKELAEKQPAGK